MAPRQSVAIIFWVFITAGLGGCFFPPKPGFKKYPQDKTFILCRPRENQEYSAWTAPQLRAGGFPKVYLLKGSRDAGYKAGLPIELQ